MTTKNKGKVALVLGVVGTIAGVALELGRIGFEVGASVPLSGDLIDKGFEGLFIAAMVGVGVGFLGLGSRFKSWFCTISGWVKLALIVDLYLLGYVSLLGVLAIHVGMASVLLQSVALVIVSRATRLQITFFICSAFLMAAHIVGSMPSIPLALSSTVSIVSYVLFTTIFSWSAFRRRSDAIDDLPTSPGSHPKHGSWQE